MKKGKGRKVKIKTARTENSWRLRVKKTIRRKLKRKNKMRTDEIKSINSNCDKDWQTTISKANQNETHGRTDVTYQSECQSWLYKSAVMSVMYGTEVRSSSVIQTRTTGSCTPHDSTTITGCYMEGQSTKWRHRDSDDIGKDGPYHQGKKIEMMRACILRMEDDRILKQCLYWRTHHVTSNKNQEIQQRLLDWYHKSRLEVHWRGVGWSWTNCNHQRSPVSN